MPLRVSPNTTGLPQHSSRPTHSSKIRHNSLPNYFMLTVGVLVTTDDTFTGTVDSDNVVRALVGARKSWKIYAESLPHAGYMGQSVIPYARDHNPFAYLTDVVNSTAQQSNIVPLTQLPTDLTNGTLP